MDIQINVPNGKSGDWIVESFEISEEDAKFNNMRAMFSPGQRIVKPGIFKRLMRNSTVVMSNTPAEISDHLSFIYKAKKVKKILINGLGLGVALSEILKSDIVKSVTIIEKSKNVINLVSDTYKDNRINIINCDAFEFKPPKGKKYNVVWHDIWDYICKDNLKEMTKLHRKYGKRTDWQGSWCKELCKRY
ncbi:MAG: hypothetical protein GQ540_03265 [Lutibacter sp.]|uniref:spermine/spermidine synthase domain-containing protein n=1 Tax=Lutibacter sp. TaxID=1925666 RepID=UPI0019F3DBC0|nr:hypothetical protein [Lutibacter sp.]NOR27531.1 hypothetical protein [Lutibacter sp.]